MPLSPWPQPACGPHVVPQGRLVHSGWHTSTDQVAHVAWAHALPYLAATDATRGCREMEGYWGRHNWPLCWACGPAPAYPGPVPAHFVSLHCLGLKNGGSGNTSKSRWRQMERNLSAPPRVSSRTEFPHRLCYTHRTAPYLSRGIHSWLDTATGRMSVAWWRVREGADTPLRPDHPFSPHFGRQACPTIHRPQNPDPGNCRYP
mmetsp:Transcript_59728/g.106578  ORF Transcript_59728/g.106578 Transcript_59728/m.106578 type:complete len:203 (+) Transcript_59728:393-1001(+)